MILYWNRHHEPEMKRNNWPRRAIAYFWAPVAIWLLSGGSVHAESSDVVVKQAAIAAHYKAFARVEPIAVLPLHAQQAGTVMDMHIMAGEPLKAGQKIGKLGGPAVQALLSQRRARLSGAQAQLDAARKSLSFQQQQLRVQLTTKVAVLQARSSLAQAQSALESDQARLRALRQMITLRAPVDGWVLTVDAANGEHMAAGQSILTIQPAHSLWLKAVYYGADASRIQTGMTGEFTPVDGNHPIPVQVSTVFSKLAPDGGEGVGLVAMGSAPAWHNGEFGKVTLNGPKHSLIAVPTRALILDQGKWWVMVHTPTGEHPQQVIPGPTRGWQTFIVRGLEPGTEVVVDHAYLKFHRSIAQRYQLPD
jgi:RND family efflux transporter MFP subunit